MRIECPNQKAVLDFDIQKKYPLVWTEREDGKHVDEFYIKPVKGTIEITADITIDTGDLKITDCLRLMKAIHTLDKIARKKAAGGIMQAVPSGPRA